MPLMDGVLIIDKPAGFTSHDVVARVRRILRERRVGHTGTLDPFATGVLVVLVGRATRLAQFLSGAEKEYEALIRLGWATDTGDLTGVPRSEQSVARAAVVEGEPEIPDSLHFSVQDIEAAMATLSGEIDQVPPMYSAKKYQGTKLYEMARRGEEIERRAVRINVSTFEASPGPGLVLTKNDDGSCDLKARIVCSAGTYVRKLAEDLGQRLGVGAHLASLRRTRAGDFEIANAVGLEHLQEKTDNVALAEILIPPDIAMGWLPFLDLREADVRRVSNGMEIDTSALIETSWPNEQQVRMRNENGELIAVGVFDKARGRLHPRVVMAVQ
jgi:tRNA pseudouridine55 synthase